MEYMLELVLIIELVLFASIAFFVAYVISGFKYPFSKATFTNIIYIVVYICKLVLGHCYTHKRDFPKCPYNTKDLTIDKPQKGKR